VKLAIPSAPRAVRLSQVPGAVRRLVLVVAVALLVVLALALGTRALSRYLLRERGFFESSVEVEGRVVSVSLPPKDQRDGALGSLHVLYTFDEKERSASGVTVPAEWGEGVGQGAVVQLLVDPKDPDHPREANFARGNAQVTALLPFGVGLGVLLGVLLVVLELRRALRRELQPLRRGMLVWLTPKAPLSDSREETVFDAGYYQQDVFHEVRARARPGRAPVKNGGKLLAAVVPSQPTWVRVIDEDLAKSLGWFVD
jgi:hypothetical protein